MGCRALYWLGLALAADVEIVLNVPRIQSKVSPETDFIRRFLHFNVYEYYGFSLNISDY